MESNLPCPSCRQELHAEDAFCSRCGTRIHARTSHTMLGRRSQVSTPASPQERSACGSCNSPLFAGEVFCPACGARCEGATDAGTLEEIRQSHLQTLQDATRGKFEFIRQIGRGGMGAVYLARELDLDRLVAIKVLASNWLTDDAMIERFRREARTIASLRHPSIVHVHGVGRADDLHYFIMDFIDGVSVAAMLRAHGPLPVAAVRAIFYHVGTALSYAHRPARGVIHRDVKPGNIMVDAEGNSFVTDFGISKVAQSQSGLTMTGLIMGTPEYMSPEQCRGDDVTFASDQYALACVVYAMLTGAPPFTGQHYRVLMGHTTEVPVPVRDLRGDCPVELASALMRMLAKPPAERWPDVKDALTAAGAKPLLADDPVREQLIGLVRGARRMDSLPKPGEAARLAGATGGDDRTPTWLRIIALPDSIEAGEEIALSARAGLGDGEEAEATSVAWESTDPSIVRIDPDTGRLLAVGAGSTMITARSAGIAESVSVEVTPPRVARLVLDPDILEIESGNTATLNVRAEGRRGQALERPVLWSSSDPRIASVSGAGMVRAHGPGAATIVAHCDGVGAAIAVTVVQPVVATVHLLGLPASLAAGDRAQVRAETRDARGQRLERAVDWSVTDERVARISPTGEIEALAPGLVRIAAECQGKRAVASITIAPAPVARIVIINAPSSLVAGEQASVVAKTFDARDHQLDRTISWTTRDAAILAVNPAGGLRALRAGTTEIIARCEAAETRATIEILPVPVATIALPPPPSGLVPGDVFHLKATPQDRNARPLDNVLVWSVDNAGIIDSLGEGRFRAAAAGTATIRAEAGGVTADLRLTVDPLRVATITLDAAPQSLQVDDHVRLGVALRDQRGDPVDRPVRWTTSNQWVARVTDDGVLVAAGPGNATITAECDGIKDFVSVTVTAAPWATVVLRVPDELAGKTGQPADAMSAPAPLASTAPAATAAATHRPAAATGRTREVAAATVEPPWWRTRRILPATVIVAAGAIWFAFSLRPDTALAPDPDITESPPPPVALVIAALTLFDRAGNPVGDAMRLTAGDTLRLDARATASDGSAVQTAGIAWTSQNPAVATVDSAGKVTARTPGNVTVSAGAGSVVRTLALTVAQRTIAQPAPTRPVPPRTTAPPAADTGAVAAPPPRRETPPQPNGTLQLIVIPWANVFVDGVQRGTESQRLELTLPPGTHRLRLENPNMQARDTTIVIRPGEPTPVRIQLRARNP